MRRSPLTSHSLFRPILTATILVLLAAVLAYIGHGARQEAIDQRDQAAARHGRTEAALIQQEREQADLRRHADLFLRLQANGIVGEPRLLEWTELLHSLRQKFHLPAMKYEFAPSSGDDGSQELTFRSMTMRLHLQVLHEEDLLHFLACLQQDPGALVLVRRCRLARPGAAEASSAPLSADCEMDWATAHRASRS